MQRLTEKQSAGYDLIEMYGMWCFTYCRTQAVQTCKDCAIYKAIQKLAEYEDLEEQGLLVRLPCKVGDTVYTISSYMDCCKEHCIWGEGCDECGYYQRYYFVKETNFQIQMIAVFNETVFLDKEEAEAKLREMEIEECTIKK